MTIWNPKRVKPYFVLRDDELAWDDLRFPFIGRNIDTTSGRLGYNYTEVGIFFAANARYAATEQVSIVVQFPHAWKSESAICPHIHWIQGQNVIPNFLMEYRIYKNGTVPPVTWTKATLQDHAFPYSAGGLQLSSFADIDMTGIDSVSAIMDIKFFRDTTNGSGLFGADPYTGDVLVKELDIHYQVDSLGSFTEYSKEIT